MELLENEEVREQAKEALLEIRPAPVETLCAAIFTGTGGLRSAVAEVLVRVGGQSVVKEMERLYKRARDMKTQIWAACVLGAVARRKSELLWLVEVMADGWGEEDVREEAARALEVAGRRSVCLAVSGCLESDDVLLRMFAMRVMAKLRCPRAGRLLKRFLWHHDRRLNVAAAEALATMDRRYRRVLLEALEVGRVSVREAAAHALARCRGKQVVEALVKVLKDVNWKVRLAAAHALSKVGADRYAVRWLIRLLFDRRKEVRWVEADALGTVADERAVQMLGIIARNWDDDVCRFIAIRSLGKIGTRSAVRELEEVGQQAMLKKDKKMLKAVYDALSRRGRSLVSPQMRAAFVALLGVQDTSRSDNASLYHALCAAVERDLRPLMLALQNRERYGRARLERILKALGDEGADWLVRMLLRASPIERERLMPLFMSLGETAARSHATRRTLGRSGSSRHCLCLKRWPGRPHR